MAGATISAECLCGEVKFESRSSPVIQLICHCEDCRCATKDDYTIAAFFDVASSSLHGKATNLEFTAASGHRTTRESCESCGTVMFDKSAGFPTLVGVLVKRIKPPFQPDPVCHVWVGSKVVGKSPYDELPKHEEGLS